MKTRNGYFTYDPEARSVTAGGHVNASDALRDDIAELLHTLLQPAHATVTTTTVTTEAPAELGAVDPAQPA